MSGEWRAESREGTGRWSDGFRMCHSERSRGICFSLFSFRAFALSRFRDRRGVSGGRKFKAVQIGGPSGGCIPAELGDTPVDYEALASAGAIMGSGGLVVLDDRDCMVDIARYFLKFTQRESCGKCTFCRVGTRRMLDILDRLCTGHGKHSDLEKLEHLADMIRRGSLCGLGQTAPNPVLSTLRYFREEYEAHIEGRCPAGRCKALIRYSVTDDCIGCTKCAQKCPAGAIAMAPFERHEVDDEKCIRCDTCARVCPVGAVVVESGRRRAEGGELNYSLVTSRQGYLEG